MSRTSWRMMGRMSLTMKRRSSKGAGMAPAERLELRGLGCSHQSGLRTMACGGFVSSFSWPVLWLRPAY